MQSSTEIRVGIFALVVLALGLLAASTLKGGLGGRAHGYLFEIWFEQAPGVGKGSPVRLAGVDVGQVVDKDVINVTETVRVAVAENQAGGLLPYELVTTWSAGSTSADRVDVLVSARRLAANELAAIKQYQRERSVARLKVRVTRDHELFTRYRYQILGGLVFGDRMLNISDTGADGLPLAPDARGDSVPKQFDAKRRVAVLGAPPANLDAIIGNAQKIMDEESSLRIRNIIANIDRATDEAGEMLAAMRATVQANQGNADTMMKNLATASEQLNAGLGEARGKLSAILDHVNATTAVTQRVAEHNEGRLNHILGNVDETTTRIAGITKDNQKLINQTVSDVAGTVKDVRGMVSDQRAVVDQTMKDVGQTARNVRDLTDDAKQRVNSLLAKTDETIGRVHDLVRDSDEHLRQITANTATITSDLKVTTGRIRDDFPEISNNLKATTKNAADASAAARDLINNPSTKQILKNAEDATGEARKLIDDIRRITGDPKVQSDIKDTLASVKNTAQRVEAMTGGVSSYKVYGTATAYYVPDQSRWGSDLQLSVANPKSKYSYHLFLDNVTAKPKFGAEMGRTLFNDRFMLRYGFYRGRLAVGADFRLWPGAKLRADFYDPGDPHLNTRFTYQFPNGFGVFGGVEDVFDKFDWIFGAQLGRPLP